MLHKKKNHSSYLRKFLRSLLASEGFSGVDAFWLATIISLAWEGKKIKHWFYCDFLQDRKKIETQNHHYYLRTAELEGPLWIIKPLSRRHSGELNSQPLTPQLDP